MPEQLAPSDVEELISATCILSLFIPVQLPSWGQEYKLTSKVFLTQQTSEVYINLSVNEHDPWMHLFHGFRLEGGNALPLVFHYQGKN